MAPASKCACGRTAPKLAGLLGRVGDAVKVRGMFIRGAEIEKALKAFPGIARFQAVITREHHQDHLEYVLELQPGAAVDVALVSDALREAVKVRGEVRTGAVPENAKRIDDRRVWT
jgi:phenylacetate-CoA ligase